ncbi:MAG: hypothetical protein NC489_19675 [Ruminococcus flavefaciens]|nr:hypothetical protein [Ruminococcus flavefaciens]
MNYITWEDYSSLYAGIPNEETFNRIMKRVKTKMDAVTHMRVSRFIGSYRKTTATDFQKQVYAQIQDTACGLADLLYTQDMSGMGTGIASVSNDGYTESYTVTTAAQKEEQQWEVIRSGLRGTGLAGVL